jgi:hypothetical protein
VCYSFFEISVAVFCGIDKEINHALGEELVPLFQPVTHEASWTSRYESCTILEKGRWQASKLMNIPAYSH